MLGTACPGVRTTTRGQRRVRLHGAFVNDALRWFFSFDYMARLK